MLLKSSSLSFAVIAALVAGLVLPMSILLGYEAALERRAAKEDLQRELSRSTEVLALSLAEPVWQVSPELAIPMIHAQVNDPRFVSVLVQEPGNDQPFYATPHPPKVDPALTLSETRPILRADREIARVTVVMSAAPFLAEKRAELWRQIWRSALSLSLSLGLILYVMRRRVLEPMSRLSQAAEALAAGGLESPLRLQGADEIARVGMAMERMRQALLAAFEALRQHAATLEDQVAQRTTELTAANTELKQTLTHLQTAQAELVEAERLASLGRMVAGVAHELNTPLGNAMTVVSALSDRYSQLAAMLSSQTPMRRSELEALVRDSLQGQDIVQRNVRKAADLVRDFKQIAVDQTSDARRSYELGQVAEEVLTLVDSNFKNTGIKIDTQIDPDLRMNGYPGALGQVLTNLLMNARLHAFDGLDQGQVRVSCRALGEGRVELRVEDNGCGMDETVRRRIFDPFFTTKLGSGGSGLGMHIVRSIVTGVLGGEIEVQSSPGQGAKMIVRLPRVAPERAEVAETLESP